MADEQPEQMIPKSRLDAKNAQIAQLEAQLAELQKAGDPTKWREKYEAEKAAHQQTRRQGTETLALVSAGITDPEDQELARWRYSRLPEDGRPELGDWLSNHAKSDRHLSALFEKATPSAEASSEAVPAEPAAPRQAADPASPPAPQPVAAPAPDNAGTVPPPEPTGGRLQEIQQWSPEQWAQNREVVLREWGLKG